MTTNFAKTLETGLRRQIATSQTADTKYK